MDRTHIDAPTDGTPGLPRDDHLQRALRHAPDRDLKAPPLLSAAILAAARRAAEPARARRPGWRAWLAAPWAGAGTVSAVLLVSGVLWVQRDALPPAVAPTEEPAEAGAVATAGRADPLKVTATVPAPAPRIEPAAREAHVGAERPTPQPAPRLGSAEYSAARAAITAPAASPAPMASRLPRPAIERPAPPAHPNHEVETAVPSPSTLAEAPQQRLRSWRPGLPGAATVVAASAPTSGSAVAVAVPSPVSPEAASAWSPIATDAVPRPLPAGWLQRLAAATPNWVEASAGHDPLAGSRSITLWRHGQPVIWLQLGRDQVQWCDAAAGCLVAAIDGAEGAALSAALPP